MTAILRRSLFGLAVLLAVGGCKGNQRTELVVEVGSNLAVPGELDKIDLAVTANGQTQHTPYSLVSDYALPLYVGIVEATAGAGSIEIVATGYLSGSPIVNETAVLNFVEGQSMLLKLFLAAECRDNPCTDPRKTCTTGGTCVDVARTPSDLTPYKPGAAGSAGGNSGSGGLSSGGGNSGSGGGSTSSGLGGSDAGVPDAPDAQPDVPIGGTAGAGGIGGAGGANGGTGGVPRPGGATSSGGATNLPDAGADLSTGTPDATTASGQTVALFHFDGTQGSTNLVDSSGWAHTATIFGNPIITTSQSKFGGASLYVNGVGSDHKNYVLADSIAKEFTFSGDFTIDFWLYVVSYTNSWGSFVAVGNSLPTALDWAGSCSGSATQLVVTASWESSGSNWCCLGATPCAGPPLNSWHHVAITRSGSKTREFVDGQAFPSAWDESIMTPIAGGSYLVISGAPCETPGAGDNGDFNGYIDELRVVNGVAVWTSNFTPPTAPYTATNAFPVDAAAPDLLPATPDSSGAGGSGGAASGGVTSGGGSTTTGGTTASAGASGGGTLSGGTPPSCNGLGATCGPSGNDDCCTSLLVPGGTFYRSYDGVDFTDKSYPATVNDFYLDKYEITVGRFRQFVNAGMGTQLSPPAAGAGANPAIMGSGWDSTWNTNLSLNTASLEAAISCGAPGGTAFQTWTNTAGRNESMPVNCVDWYTAFAFCAWDGGRLATEAEWNYAAAGGSEQRYYPWSSPPTSTTIDDSYAVYNCDGSCIPLNVGSKSPKGDGKWGQTDLAGNVWEWTLDWYASPYLMPCTNCADITEASASNRVVRGGDFNGPALNLRSANRLINYVQSDSYDFIGARCARTSQ
ncbi:MAG: SUMF1/EgtB/PvdO family nonheme iron enzyme [Polyangia bacterium]|jgi:formylglycine-generating enzyme required for sulfatase activity